MADGTLNDQLATTAPQNGDLLYLLRSPYGGGDDRKITFANLEAGLELANQVGFSDLAKTADIGVTIQGFDANTTTLGNTATGTGAIVRATSPTLVTPALGTPSALVGTNITGTASGLTAGTVTTNANLTGPITSVGNATSVASQTGTGSKFVMDTSPTLVTPNLGTPSAAVLTNATGLPISTGVSGLGAGVADFLATPSSANLAAAVTGETGSGALVFGTSPTLTSPVINVTSDATGDIYYRSAGGFFTRLGIGSADQILTVTSGLPSWQDAPPSSGGDALTTNPLSQFAATTSAELRGVMSDETGTGLLVFATSPTLITPVLGVASATSLTLSSPGNTASHVLTTDGTQTVTNKSIAASQLTGLGTGVGTFLATPSSANLAAAVTDETGTGALVFASSPTMTNVTTDILHATLSVEVGDAGVTDGILYFSNATNVNAVDISAGATSASYSLVLPLAQGGSGTYLKNDGSGNLSWDTPAGGGAAAFTDLTDVPSSYSGQGGKAVRVNAGATALEFFTLSGGGDALTSDPLSQFAATTSAQLAGVISDETGSGALVFATSPTLVTPALGTPSAAVLTNATGLPISTGVSGLGTGVATFLATPSSANLAAAVTGETGTGALVFGTSPTLTTPNLGTPSTLVLTNATGLVATTGLTATGTKDATTFLRGDDTWAVFTNYPWRGPWVTATQYFVNDVFEHDGSSYVVVADHTSGTFATDLAAGEMDLFVQGSAGGGATTALDNLASVAINAALLPASDNAIALGSTTKNWADVFIGSGGVINFNNGDVTVTHSSNLLNIAGGDLQVPKLGLGAANAGNALIEGTISGALHGFDLIATATSDFMFAGRVSGDSNQRFVMFANGELGWGPGTTGTDTLLRRNGVGSLYTATKLTVQDDFSLGFAATAVGKMLFYNATNSNAVTIQSGTTTSNYTLTLPVADGTNGQVLQTNGSGVLSWASASGLSWNSSITGTTTDGLTLTIGASATDGISALKLVANNTQGNQPALALFDLGTSSNVQGLMIQGTGHTNTAGAVGTGKVHLTLWGNTTNNAAKVLVVGNGGTWAETGSWLANGTLNLSPNSANAINIDMATATTADFIDLDITATANWTGKLIDFVKNISVSGLTARTASLIDISHTRTISGSSSITDNFDFVKFVRGSTKTNASGTYTTQGSVGYFENQVTPTAGTLTDTVTVAKFVQDNDSTGDIAQFIKNSVVEAVVTTKGNFVLGATAAGSTAENVLALSNSAVAPTTSVDLVQLYATDASAGNATLGIVTETAVAADVTVPSTNSLTVRINGTLYKILLATP